MGLKKGPWTPQEDRKLVAYIQQHGHGSWRALPAKAGLQRCGKSCRLRWNNYLRPDIKRGKFSLQEDRTILQLHAFLGNRWSTIAAHLPKRTDNEIKNYWNSHLKKRLIRMGIDPITHRPADTDARGSGGGGRSKGAASNLSHMAQWENARLEAEARLASKLGSTSSQPPARLIIGRIPARSSLPPCLDVLRAWQSSSAKPINPKGNNMMHSMYAIVLAAADDNLESPTSTLSFPESKLPVSSAVGQLNENFLAPAVSTPAVAASTVAASGVGFSTEIMDHMSGLENDDILMASVEEAFIAARYDDVLTVLTNNIMEEGRNGNVANIYDSNENSADGNLEMMNRNGSNCNLNSEESNVHYWDAILNMVNGLGSGSTAFCSDRW